MKQKNIVLIILDTMRKDYADMYIWPILKKYGFKKYEKNITTSPWTIPSHTSMLTGLYPLYHGAHLSEKFYNERLVALNAPIWKESLPAQLQNLGFETVLLSANALVSPVFGFRFQKFVDTSPLKNIEIILKKEELKCIAKAVKNKKNKLEKFLSVVSLCDPRIVLRILEKYLKEIFMTLLSEWPKEKGITNTIKYVKSAVFEKTPVFLVINIMEVHEPYLLSIEFEPKRLWPMLYKSQTIYLAKKLDKLISLLFKKLPPENTLYIITSDHGQLLGENGIYGHTYWLNDEILTVPLYIRSCCDKLQETASSSYYISLTQLKDLILRGKLEPKEWALAESFAAKKNGKTFFVHRIAVYYKNYKGIFNVDEWKWECWKTYNGEKEVPEEAKREMTKIVVKHLKTAVVKDKVKKLVPKKLAPKKGASF